MENMINAVRSIIVENPKLGFESLVAMFIARHPPEVLCKYYRMYSPGKEENYNLQRERGARRVCHIAIAYLLERKEIVEKNGGYEVEHVRLPSLYIDNMVDYLHERKPLSRGAKDYLQTYWKKTLAHSGERSAVLFICRRKGIDCTGLYKPRKNHHHWYVHAVKLLEKVTAGTEMTGEAICDWLLEQRVEPPPNSKCWGNLVNILKGQRRIEASGQTAICQARNRTVWRFKGQEETNHDSDQKVRVQSSVSGQKVRQAEPAL